MWPNFDGKPYNRNELAALVNAADFSRWRHKDGTHGRPAYITLHNTSTPDMALWLSWSAEKRQQYIRNMQPYYERMGWRGGPHFFVPPQQDICAFGFNDLMSAGTHASCFNTRSIGIEMVGEFDRERFDTDPGRLVADNAIFLMALLHNRIGMTPQPYRYNEYGLHFHMECRADNHHCPGNFVRKPDVIARIEAEMQRLAAPLVIATVDGAGADAAAPMAAADIAPDLFQQIQRLAGASALARVDWLNRGRAPAGYVKGMALSFAAIYDRWRNGDATVLSMAQADRDDIEHDALTWYESTFNGLGMSNAANGADTLRHLFVLLIGLGMRESSGRYCEGRDRSADNITGETAEAGLFQMSWNARHAIPAMGQLFAEARGRGDDALLPVFCEGVHATHRDLANFGDGDGAEFQALCKSHPSFAVETAAIGLRYARTHWGPIKSRAAQVLPEADDLLRQVQALVDGAAGHLAAVA